MKNLDDFNEQDLPDDEEVEREPVYLTDEDGVESPFDILDLFEYKGKQYAVFTPWIDEEDIDEDDEEPLSVGVLILSAEDTGEELDLTSVEDEDLLEELFNYFMERENAADQSEEDED